MDRRTFVTGLLATPALRAPLPRPEPPIAAIRRIAAIRPIGFSEMIAMWSKGHPVDRTWSIRTPGTTYVLETRFGQADASAPGTPRPHARSDRSRPC